MTPESAAAATSTPVLERRAPVPPEPATIEDTGLSYEALRQLLTKALYAGEQSGLALGEKLCLPYALLESLLDHLRVEKLIEVRGAAGSGTAGFRYALTDLGRERAVVGLRGQRLRRARPGAAAPVHRRDAQAEGGTRLPHEGTDRRGLHAPGGEPPDARPARSGRELGQVDLPLRPSQATARRSWPKASAARWAATCTCRGRSTSTARSSRSSTR